MPKPAEPLPPEPEFTRTEAFKEWLRTRDWEQLRDWRRLGGENRGFKIAGVAGLVGLLLAVWLMSSWAYRKIWHKNGTATQIVAEKEQATPPEKLAPESDTQPAPKLLAAAPQLDVNLEESAAPPTEAVDSFKPPIVKKPAADESLAELPKDGPEEKVAVAATKPVSLVTESPAPRTPASAALPEEDPKPLPEEPKKPATLPFEDEPAPATKATAAAPEQPLVEQPAPKAETVAEPQEVIEPVVPVEEKPKVIGEKEEAAAPREEEGFGTKSSDASPVVVRGETKEPVAPVAEKPAEKPAEEPAAVPVAPVEEKKEERPAPSVDDERIGTPASTPLAPLPETTPAEKPAESKPVAEKPVDDQLIEEKPAEQKPAAVEPASVKAEPFSEPPADPKPAATAPAKPKEMPPEEEPAFAREPEKTIVQPTSRQQPVEPATAAIRPVGPPQIDFDLIAPLRVEKGNLFKIGFHVKNIGTTDIDGLVFSIKLPASLRHYVGREVEYHIDHLAPGQSRTALMHVLAEEAEMALIRAEMTAGSMRLASSDRQIQVRGKPSDTARHFRRDSMIMPAQHLAFPPSASPPNCECQVP